jgi:hypothetical protein
MKESSYGYHNKYVRKRHSHTQSLWNLLKNEKVQKINGQRFVVLGRDLPEPQEVLFCEHALHIFNPLSHMTFENN